MNPEEMTDNEQEPGVCCACKSAENLQRHFLSPTLFFEVCAECKDDGSYHAWLTVELEKAVEAGGATYRIDEHGRKLWSDLPPPTDP